MYKLDKVTYNYVVTKIMLQLDQLQLHGFVKLLSKEFWNLVSQTNLVEEERFQKSSRIPIHTFELSRSLLPPRTILSTFLYYFHFVSIDSYVNKN